MFYILWSVLKINNTLKNNTSKYSIIYTKNTFFVCIWRKRNAQMARRLLDSTYNLRRSKNVVIYRFQREWIHNNPYQFYISVNLWWINTCKLRLFSTWYLTYYRLLHQVINYYTFRGYTQNIRTPVYVSCVISVVMLAFNWMEIGYVSRRYCQPEPEPSNIQQNNVSSIVQVNNR